MTKKRTAKKSTPKIDRGWVPRRLGQIYCSPRCGAGCTWAAHQRAAHEVRLLCEALGPGWQPVIWENGGWHYEARKGKAEVKVLAVGGATSGSWKIEGYSAWLQSDAGQVITDYLPDPVAAVRKMLDLAQRRAGQLVKDIASVGG